MVAGGARRDDVLPHRGPAARTGYDVVEREAVPLGAAVDAFPAVSREQHAPGDALRHAARHADVGDEPDHVRSREGRARGPERLPMALDHLRFALPDED